MINSKSVCHFYAGVKTDGRCSILSGMICDGINENCSFFKTDKEFVNGVEKPVFNSLNVGNYIIINTITGGFIHESLFKIKFFRSYSAANKYIKDTGLNPSVYKISQYRGK